MTQTLLAYHDNPEIKAKYLSRVRKHRKADQLIKGKYWEDGKGCAVGCTIHSSDHAAYETELGIPRILARLEDGIFESLDNGHAQAWPERFLAAITPGADLSLVWPKFAVWLMVDPRWGVLQYAQSERCKEAIQFVADAYGKVVAGTAKDIDWRQLRRASADAADAAAAYAAYAANAAAAAAAYAAYAANAAAAAYAAAYAANAASAAAAAAAAAYAAADDAARQESRIAQSDKLIDLLTAAKR